MDTNTQLKPDFIFEVSWEICNKVGGIYTVISTKAKTLVNQLENNYILIGPDVWKEIRENPDFEEDKSLYKSWRLKAEADGLRFRIGRWKIAGKPIAILVDFTPYFPEKDKIFADFWMQYGLDSISGQWDYIEPAMFGYAAARVIESFYQYNITSRDKFIAHFHEWMTGSGILYLKNKIPQSANVFTTHATAIGRSIAGNGLPLYKFIDKYNSLELSTNFGITAKHSLEQLTAVNSDVFTTVSELTANECKYLLSKEVDVVTPNGFEDSFVPDAQNFDSKRQTARNKLKQIAQAILKQKIADDTVFIVNSGRYEFTNKGIDVFIEAISKLNASKNLNKEIAAFILVPAGHEGPKNEVIKNIDNPDFTTPNIGAYLSHYLFNEEADPILKKIKECKLQNSPDDKVKIFFVPVYLNGEDGVFNTDYYDLLIGFDISVFPSYYEPWGYTPLESIAFSIPTITTTLAGFGLWMLNDNNTLLNGVKVISRNDDNEKSVIAEISNEIELFINSDVEKIKKSREKAFEHSRTALWTNLIEYYKKAYSIALKKSNEREDLYKSKQLPEIFTSFNLKEATGPSWKKIYVQSEVPPSLEKLRKLAKNVWWSWHPEAGEIFEIINKELWIKSNYNPIAFLESLTYDQYVAIQHYELTRNNEFIDKLKNVYDAFTEYMQQSVDKTKDTIAYFSMEFGLHDSIKIFSGGLGILAGDYLKQASDSNKNIVGVGLLYRYGYFQQHISIKGEQIAEKIPQRFSFLPITPVRDENDNWITISIALPGRNMYAKVWRVDIGRIPLYLLDTDIEENQAQDRIVTHQLYGGDWENRFKQELLLGVGGIRMLNKLNIQPEIYHINEGHAAFLVLERLREFVELQKIPFAEASEIVRASTLFTTHTPVPAGHDHFSEDMLRTYISHYPDRLKISWNTLINLGKFTEDDPQEKFSMSVLAAKLSQEVNGVSKIHGRVTREMFQKIWDGYFPEELHIGHVTNGVHYPTWTAKPWQNLYDEVLGQAFIEDHANPENWQNIKLVPDATIWSIRQEQRKKLINFVKHKLLNDLTQRQESPKTIFETIEAFNENALTIGFARRFATYKRAHLLFKNPERLAKIINNPEQPVQFIFAGKAHPHDGAGQGLIKNIIEISRKKEFLGKITFLENYDMQIGGMLTQGVDIWLNTPTRPLEASGTSGEKAIMNGVVNLSVLDGWWAEGYKPNAGWALKEERTYKEQEIQDELDAETIYNMLEDEIIPMFYSRNQENVPMEWVSHIKNTIADIAPRFTMKRMIDDYYKFYYKKLLNRTKLMRENNYELAHQISRWKTKVARAWNNIEIVKIELPDSKNKPLLLGEKFKAEIIINPLDISHDDIGIEVIFGMRNKDEAIEIVDKYEMKKEIIDGTLIKYSSEIFVTRSGVFDFAFRMFPKNKILPHRQDFNLIRWI